MNPAGQLHSGIRPTPWPGSKVKKASSLPAHGDCLSATEQLQTCQEVSWERNRAAAEHRVTWNSIPPDPVCKIQENKPRSETRENWGREELTATEELLHSDSWETFVARGNSTGWVDQLSTKRLCCMNFRNGLKKMESSVIDTHYIGRTDFWNEEKSTYGSHSFPSLPCSPAPHWPALVD